MPWKIGSLPCSIVEPVPAAPGNPDIVWLRFRPPGRSVESVAFAVVRDDDTGPVGAVGGPYTLVWATSGMDNVLPDVPRIFSEVTVDEADVVWVDPHIGFAVQDIAFDLLDDEVEWVGVRLDDHGGTMPPSAVALCASSASLAADTGASTGTCPGSGCVTGPLPAPYTNMSGLGATSGH